MAVTIHSDESIHCPYCNCDFPLIFDETYKPYTLQFNSYGSTPDGFILAPKIDIRESITVKFFHCPKCDNFIIKVVGLGELTKGIEVPILPKSNAIQFPNYVPESIRNDYEEACAIVWLSPKASATLSRRCLQSMIRDFWKVNETTLYKEISILESKVDKAQWDVLNALRQLGNIGAHPEADVNSIINIEPEEATKLLKVIELLIKQWYIKRHDEQQLLSDVLLINTSKQTEKKNK